MRIAMLLLVLSGCGASPWVWMREANTLAAGPLTCAVPQIATRQYRGFTFDSIGCDRAIRQVCRDQVCEPIGDVAYPTDPGYMRFSQRVTRAYEHMDELAPEVVADCGHGRAVGATMLVNDAGVIEEAYVADNDLKSCLRRILGRLPRGSETMMITHVFRPAASQ